MIPSSSRSSAGPSDSRGRCTSSSNEERKDISALISSAQGYLANVLTDLSQQSTVVTLERRKSYWRILRASKHLSIVKSSVVAIDSNSRGMPLLVTQNQSVRTELLSSGPLLVPENTTTRTELSESENVMTESLLTGMPLPVTVKDSTVTDLILAGILSPLVMNPEIMTEFHSMAPNTSTETERIPIALDMHLPNSTTIETETNYEANDAAISSDANKISVLPQPVIAITDGVPSLASAKVSSQPVVLVPNSFEDLSTQLAPQAVMMAAETKSNTLTASRIVDEKVVNKRIIADEILKDFSQRMGNISVETNIRQWLEISRSYWTALRNSKRYPVVPVEVPVLEASLTYFSSNQMQDNSSNLRGSMVQTSNSMNAAEEVDLSSDRMHMSGFAGIAKKLPSMHPADVTLTLWGLDKFELWPTQIVATNPSYTYEDNPLPGWSKNICVRMGGKLQGSLEITYCPPERTRRLRNKIEILAYLSRYNLSTYLTSRFDFRSVFCVCHTPEDSGSYLECSFGRAGCNRWLHSHCVGLGKRKEGELRDMATVICPLCTLYLESIGASDYMKNKT
jgi:Methyl-CpG binding domain